jgi:transposase
MSQINSIREMRKAGYSVAKIAREAKVDEKTVRKYLKMEDFSPKVPEVKREVAPKLNPYKPTILKWLEEDKGNWAKQRHTAQKIHDRLVQEFDDYDCSYPTLVRYVRSVRQEHIEAHRGTLELVWHPGQAQADFGELECYEEGVKVRKRFFVISFPHSNVEFTQIFNGETAECICQGLQDVFEFIGGVPSTVVIDNASGAGRRIGSEITETELFKRFRAHYGFSIRFCTPASGWEKGHVENKIGSVRRNRFVPLPHINDIEEFNKALIAKAMHELKKAHYKKHQSLESLFNEDLKALQDLPSARFNVCRFEFIKADTYGKVRVSGNHYYSSCPEFSRQVVLVGIRAHFIEVYDKEHNILVTHRRRFGKQRTDEVDPSTSLAVLTRNIGAWSNSGIREVLPPFLKEYLDNLEREELKSAVRAMSALKNEYGLEHAIEALSTAVTNAGSSPLADAAVFAARMAEFDPFEEIEEGPDLNIYDTFLGKGVGK